MKTLFALTFAMISAGAIAQDKPIKTTYNVVPSESKIVYVGKKVTGQHTGSVDIKPGSTLVFTGDALTGGEITADMNTITSTDITDKDANAKYVGHMKSADFFNVEKYPEAKLVIKDSKKTDKGLQVNADLTMIGQTKPITFVVTNLKKTADTVTAKSDLKLNRTLWGLKYGSGSFFKGLGDKAINDEFTLTVDIKAKK